MRIVLGVVALAAVFAVGVAVMLLRSDGPSSGAVADSLVQPSATLRPCGDCIGGVSIRALAAQGIEIETAGEGVTANVAPGVAETVARLTAGGSARVIEQRLVQFRQPGTLLDGHA